jgi:hypothetical protein
MKLTDKHIEVIRDAVRTVDFGSVTINVSTTADKLEIVIENRIRVDKEPEKPQRIKKT